VEKTRGKKSHATVPLSDPIIARHHLTTVQKKYMRWWRLYHPNIFFCKRLNIVRAGRIVQHSIDQQTILSRIIRSMDYILQHSMKNIQNTDRSYYTAINRSTDHSCVENSTGKHIIMYITTDHTAQHSAVQHLILNSFY
jgi:hypothetical protein